MEGSVTRPGELRVGSEATSGTARMFTQVRGSAIKADCRAVLGSCGSCGFSRSIANCWAVLPGPAFWAGGHGGVKDYVPH